MSDVQPHELSADCWCQPTVESFPDVDDQMFNAVAVLLNELIAREELALGQPLSETIAVANAFEEFIARRGENA